MARGSLEGCGATGVLRGDGQAAAGRDAAWRLVASIVPRCAIHHDYNNILSNTRVQITDYRLA